MAQGTNLYEGLAIPAYGNASMTGQTAADDVLTITGAGSQTGRYIVCESSAGTEAFAVGSSNFTHKWSMGTVALASLATGAAATVALTGLTTNHVVMVWSNQSKGTPTAYVNDADKLGYSCQSAITSPAMTVNYLALLTV